jgi:dihydrofolate reductase
MGYEYPHVDKAVYIITRSERESIGSFNFYTGDLGELIADLKSKPGGNIYCDGGAEIANELMRNNLIDEFIISVIPILLGDGVLLFRGGQPEQSLRLINSKSFEKGLVQLHYSKVE